MNQRADTPRTAAGRYAASEHPYLLDKILAIEDEAARFASSITFEEYRIPGTEAAAEPAAAEPPDLVSGIAYALARADLPTDTETSRDYATRLAPLVQESGWLAPRGVTPALDDWEWFGDSPGQRHGAGDGWMHHHPDGTRWVHPEKDCPLLARLGSPEEV